MAEAPNQLALHAPQRTQLQQLQHQQQQQREGNHIWHAWESHTELTTFSFLWQANFATWQQRNVGSVIRMAQIKKVARGLRKWVN